MIATVQITSKVPGVCFLSNTNLCKPIPSNQCHLGCIIQKSKVPGAPYFLNLEGVAVNGYLWHRLVLASTGELMPSCSWGLTHRLASMGFQSFVLSRPHIVSCDVSHFHRVSQNHERYLEWHLEQTDLMVLLCLNWYITCLTVPQLMYLVTTHIVAVVI